MTFGLSIAHPMPVVPGNPKPPTQRDVAVYSQFISQCCQAEHPALAVLSRPRLVLAEPVSPGSARGRPCCRGTALWISEPKKNRKKYSPPPPSISAAYFRAVWGQPQNTSADVLGAPGCSRIPCPCPRRSLLQCRMQEERPVHTANAEAVIYSPSRMQKCTKQDASQSSFGAAS